MIDVQSNVGYRRPRSKVNNSTRADCGKTTPDTCVYRSIVSGRATCTARHQYIEIASGGVNLIVNNGTIYVAFYINRNVIAITLNLSIIN